MVSLEVVRESNASLSSTIPSQIAFFVGATSGLGLATLREYARRSNAPKIYIVGRAESKLSNIIEDLKRLNPEGTYTPIVSEIELFKNVDAACDEFKSKETKLDLLVMSPGYLKLQKLPDNEDGIEPTISLRYYVRARFVYNLLSPLNAAPSARVVSIHGAGLEGQLDESDFLLKDHYSMKNAAMYTSTMNTLFLQEIACNHRSISCVHVFPGVIVTPAFETISEDWYFPFRWIFTGMVRPILKLFTTSLPDSGERHLFLATSARYPPADGREGKAGIPLREGTAIAVGSDWKQGSGCYLVALDGETVGDKKLLDSYREQGMDKKIWEHTLDVFEQAGVEAR